MILRSSRRDLAECLVDDAVELGPVLADAEGVPVRRVDGTGGAEVADAAVVDFFRDVELVVDHGVDFAEGDFLQPLQRVFDGTGVISGCSSSRKSCHEYRLTTATRFPAKSLEPVYARFRFVRGGPAGHALALGGLPGHDDAGSTI